MSANLRNLVTAEDFHCGPVKARTVILWANKMNKHIEDFMTEGSKSAQSREKRTENAEVTVSDIWVWG